MRCARGAAAATEISKTYDIYGGLPALQQYVDEIGQKRAGKSHCPQLDYRFTVVDSPEGEPAAGQIIKTVN